MRRPLYPVFLAVLLASFLVAVPSWAQTLNYTVNVNFDQSNPYGRAKAVLSGVVATSGTTLAINGTPVPIAAANATVLRTLIATGPTNANSSLTNNSANSPDQASAQVAPDGSTLVINFYFNSLFTSPSQFCSPFPGAVGQVGSPFVYTVSIQGAAAAQPTSSALVGYVSAGVGGNSIADCTHAVRRQKTDISWGAGAAGPPPATDGRVPIRNVLILDESGSMLSPPGCDVASGGSASSKWTLTAEATQEFVNALEAQDPGINDQLAVVFFDDQHTAFQDTANSTDPNWFLKLGGQGATFQTLLAEVNKSTHPRAGSTSIGGGLVPAIQDAVCFASKDPISDPEILLMTDGQQNTDPSVSAPSSNTIEVLTYAPLCNGASASNPLYAAEVPIFSVYFDLPAATSPALLPQAISNQTAGLNSSGAECGADTAGSFVDNLVQTLKGGTSSYLLKNKGTLAPKQSSSVFTVPVDGTVKRLIVVLGWYPAAGNENAFTLAATAPGETSEVKGDRKSIFPTRAIVPAPVSTPTPAAKPLPSKPAAATKPVAKPVGKPSKAPEKPELKAVAVTPQVSVRGGDSYFRSNPYNIVAAVDMPANGAGNWTFQVVPVAGNEGKPAASIPYHLYVLGEESQLEFIPSFAGGVHGTGQPLVLNLNIGLARTPVLGSGSNLTVSVDGPQGAIGTLLHDLSDPGGPASPEGTATTPSDVKTNNLTRTANVITQTTPKPLGQALTFKDLGAGHYQVLLSSTQIPGRYVFHVAINLNGPSGAIQRLEDEETQIEVLPTATQVTSVSLGGGAYNLTIVPIDPFHNYLGPGFGGHIHVTFPSGGAQLAGITDPTVNGTYVINVTNVAAGTDPPVVISVGGTPVAGGTVAHPGPPNTPPDAGTGSNGPPSITCNCRVVKGSAGDETSTGVLGSLVVAAALLARRRRGGKRTNT